MTTPPSDISAIHQQSLKTEIRGYETELQNSRTRQDKWNNWYLGLGVAAILTATGFGVVSWVCQKKASSIELASRPTADKLQNANARLREAIDHDAQVEVAKAQADAFNASERAGNAEKGAGEANERAATAQASLAQAEQHAAEANAKAEGFRLDIAKANQGAAEANRVAEQERLARLQLEARLADRVITPDQQERLRQAFTSLNGETIDVVVVGDTPEISNTANAIIVSLSSAGVLLNHFHPLGASGVRGVTVGFRKDASLPERQACEAFVSILRETLEGGIGAWDYNRMDVSKATGTQGGNGKIPMGQSPIRIIIASK